MNEGNACKLEILSSVLPLQHMGIIGQPYMFVLFTLYIVEYVIPTAPPPPLPKIPLFYGISPCYGVSLSHGVRCVFVLARVMVLP